MEDDSILSEMNSLDCHLVPIGSCSRIQTKTFITHKLKLEWFRDGYSVAALNNFMYIGGGYNPSGGEVRAEGVRLADMRAVNSCDLQCWQ